MKPVFVFMLLGLAACDSSSSKPAMDLATSARDMASKDLASLLSCQQTQACIVDNCTPETASTCVPACIAQLDPAAKSYFDALAACSGPACTVVDGGPGPCAAPMSQACADCVQQYCAAEQAACTAH